MSLQDPISNMFVSINNAGKVKKPFLRMYSSKLKVAIAKVLLEEGYIAHFSVSDDMPNILSIDLKYSRNKPIITCLKRISLPSCRIYAPCDKLPKVCNGMGIAIVSTPKGVVSSLMAKKLNCGGELIGMVF